MLQQQIEQLFDHPPENYLPAHAALFQSFKDALNAGEVRAAEPDEKSPIGLARQRLGEKRHPPRLSHRRHHGHVH